MGRRGIGRALALVPLTALALAVPAAGPASAAVKGTLEVEYSGAGTFSQQDDSSSLPRTSDATLTWDVTSEIPLAGSTGPYRYSQRNSKQGTVESSANWTNGPTTCKGQLSVSDANGVQFVGQFEFDYAKKGSTFLDKGTLKGPSPVPLNSGFIGQFSDANGPGCTGYQPITQIGGTPDDPDGNVSVKLDLAKLAKAKGKTLSFPVGLTKTYSKTATDVSWKGSVVVTLEK
jgi:hypothetical protein